MISKAKKRVVIVGLGDTGLLAAVRLSQRYDVTAITTKPCFVSGQELGMRLSDPRSWRREYLLPFSAYRRLDRVNIIHGKVETIDSGAATVQLIQACGAAQTLGYDALLIASGVSNGFWRSAQLQQPGDIEAQFHQCATQFREAGRIAIVGGGPTAVSSAANLATRYPEKSIHLFYRQKQLLPGYHPRVRRRIESQLGSRAVHLHAAHQVQVGKDTQLDRLDRGTVTFTGSTPPFHADVILWAIGQLKPNNAYIDASMLDQHGFVATSSSLRVKGQQNIFAVGDIAATDPLRSSARNGGYQIASYNIDCLLRARHGKMKSYSAPSYRWGSILGTQSNGLTVYGHDGRQWRIPRWATRKIIFPWVVRRGIYKGVR